MFILNLVFILSHVTIEALSRILVASAARKLGLIGILLIAGSKRGLIYMAMVLYFRLRSHHFSCSRLASVITNLKPDIHQLCKFPMMHE